MNKEYFEAREAHKNAKTNFFPYGRGPQSPSLYSYPMTSYDHIIYIDDLSWLDDHQDRLQAIRSAGPDDTIRIVINTPGGAVNIAMAYISAFRETQAQIVAHAEGMVCSAGTILWLSIPERTVSPMTEFMFHNYQGYAYGDGANMHSQIVFWERHFNRIVKEFYGNVLTQEEIDKILTGGQVWMDENEILTRTKGTLMDAKNIALMKEGKHQEISTGGPADAKEPPTGATLRIFLAENEEMALDLKTLCADDFAGLNNEELQMVAETLIALKEGKEEPTKLPKTGRDKLLEMILSTAAEIRVDIFGE